MARSLNSKFIIINSMIMQLQHEMVTGTVAAIYLGRIWANWLETASGGHSIVCGGWPQPHLTSLGRTLYIHTYTPDKQ